MVLKYSLFFTIFSISSTFVEGNRSFLAILLLSQNSSRAIELAMEVDAAERAVDEGHRRILQELYKSNLDILVLLRLKDLTQHLEEIADAAEDAADAIRIIAVARGH